jgi:hypothetical protein
MVEIERAMQFLAKPAPGDLAQVCKVVRAPAVAEAVYAPARRNASATLTIGIRRSNAAPSA